MRGRKNSYNGWSPLCVAGRREGRREGRKEGRRERRKGQLPAAL